MDDKELEKVGEWLISRGYDIDLNDCLWMESYAQDHKFRDIAELIYDYHNEYKQT